MGLMEQPAAAAAGLVGRSWSAQMIAPSCDAGVGTRNCYVAKDFDLADTAGAVLHISAMGIYRAFINGQRVGTDELTPGWTCYDDRIAYQTYDVSALLQKGKNLIVIWLNDGWWRSPLMWKTIQVDSVWGDKIAAIAELTQNGKLVLSTDASWTSGLLPITKAGIYYGEDYDARLETLTDTDGVAPVAFDTGLLVAHETSPVKELAPLTAVKEWQDAEGRTIIDFGQNAAGYVRITVEGDAGAVVYVDHAEVLGPQGDFDKRNYRTARAAMQYTLKGDGVEVYAPTFSFTGYRYARVAITGNARLVSAVSAPISSVPEVAGGFECAVPAVNRLVQNTIWSQRANFIEVPTDCPQRDERLGWSGDAQVFAGTACWLADSGDFLRKYLRDLMADQRPDGAIPHFSPDPTRLRPDRVPGDWAGSTGWGDAITVIPWQLYLQYGDASVLHETFDAMVRWIDYLWSISDGPIIRPHSGWGGKGFTFGDWLQPTGDTVKPRPTIADDCAATIYHFISTELVAKVAEVIGKDAAPYRKRAEDIRAAFRHEYFSPAGRLAHNDQTSYALAFLYGLVPVEYDAASRAYFRKVIEDVNHVIGTGFIGTPALLPALCKLGMTDLAEKVFLNPEVPGWLYQVNMGATTIWERWDAIAPDGTIFQPQMNSYNHYAYGAVCQWLFESVAGVAPVADKPGYDVVRLDPQILPALGPVSMWHDCRHGRIEAAWQIDGNTVTYTVTLPKGVRGEIVQNPAYSGYTVTGTVGAGTQKISFNL